MWPLSNLLKTFVRKGQLTVIDVDSSTHEFGSGEDGPHVTMRLHDKALRWKLFLNPELQAAEAYMDGGLTFEEGSGCYDLLYLFSVNRGPLASHKVQGALRQGWRAMRRRQQQNDVDRAKRQARHHYDLSTELYELFLDKDLNYSCAFFRSPDDTLEQAQAAKLTRATAKLRLQPGMSVVEIGSGWGSFAIKLAQQGAQVTALNVSPEQIAISKERAQKAGVADKIDFVWKDYREFNGEFDRVVSVGMMEHVGIGHFDDYFGKVRELLKPDGYAFIHSIGRMTQPGNDGSVLPKIHLPRGLRAGALRNVRGDGAPGIVGRRHGSPCGCITIIRCASGGRDLPPTGTRPRCSTMNGSAECGSFISALPNSGSCTAPTWCSSFCSHASATRFRSTGTSSMRPKKS